MILASINGSTTDYFHEDALGSVRLETSSSATTLFSSDYRPYGPSYGATASVAFGYTGKPTDAATGLYYSGARFYDPASGRFMTLDSSTGSQTAPLTLNRYIYACDDPMSVVDPTGHFGMPPPDMAKGNNSPDPVAQAVSAISNWWSGLPPVDKIALVVAVGVAAGVLTCGVADVAVGGVLGAASEAGEVADAAGAGDSALGAIIGKASQGAAVNIAQTTVQDLATGQSPTFAQFAETAAVGAATGGIDSQIGGGITASIAAKAGVGAVSQLAESELDGQTPAQTEVQVAGGAISGAVDGGYDSYTNLYPAAFDTLQNSFDLSWAVVMGIL